MAPAVLNATPKTLDVRLADEEPLYEIANGQHVELPAMSAYATWIASRLDHRLGPFAEDLALGTVVTEMLFVLDSGQNLRRRPDVAFVSAEQWPLNRELPESGDWEVVPDLAVEVVSPTDEFSDVVAKVCAYFEYGVRRVWVILPEERQVYVYESPTQVQILAITDTLSGGDMFPGFTLPLVSLFARGATSP
ncbi:MAG: Uma2 family endonuclease [Planctomycetota bacterium]|nr:Uma2 family endonuclease [Planctomycetota bacterium]